MPETFIVNMMLETLQSSRYKTQIKTILAAHSAAKIPIDTVDKLSTALEEDDIFDGKAWGGAGVSPSKTTPSEISPKG
jgi:hypothetical protein